MKTTRNYIHYSYKRSWWDDEKNTRSFLVIAALLIFAIMLATACVPAKKWEYRHETNGSTGLTLGGGV